MRENASASVERVAVAVRAGGEQNVHGLRRGGIGSGLPVHLHDLGPLGHGTLDLGLRGRRRKLARDPAEHVGESCRA